VASLIKRYRRVKSREFLETTKSAIEAGDPAAVSRTLSRGRSLIGRAAVTVLDTVISGRMTDSLSHAEASAALTSCARSYAPPSDEAWFLVESLAQAAGCFSAAAAFGLGGIDAMSSSSNPSRAFLGAVHSRNLAAAQRAYSEGAQPKDPFWVDAGHYLWLWSAGQSGVASWSGDTSWRAIVEGRSVSIVGPAPTPARARKIPATTLVARVIAPGVVSWPEDDIAAGRCDLAYANSKTTKWFIRENKAHQLEGFSYLSFRTDSGTNLGIDNSRVSFHHKKLLPMPWDRTNMVPLAAWDLLHVPDVSVSITGTTFFASQTAYTENDVRFDAERNQNTDQAGSTGIVLERCVSFSHHNIGGHVNLMANLAEAGVLRFDDDGARVVALSYADYLAEIDQFYGKRRV
jgi:hypothetical protein